MADAFARGRRASKELVGGAHGLLDARACGSRTQFQHYRQAAPHLTLA